MGQKVNPHGLRVGIIKGWDSIWYAEKNFGDLLVEDFNIRKFLKKKLYAAGISRISIHRTNNRVKVNIHTAKPGIVIGRGGAAIADLQNDVQKLVKNPQQRASINITEIKFPEVDAQLVAEDIAKQLENRVTFRRAMRQAMTRTMKGNIAKGIKSMVSGRLGGADIARSETYHEGTIPLQTLRADIDYGFAEAKTTYGKLGVKVWIYKGEILPGSSIDENEGIPAEQYKERPPRDAGRNRPGGPRPSRGDNRNRDNRPRRGEQGARKEGGR